MQLRDVRGDDVETYVRMRCDPVMMAELGGPLPLEGIGPKVARDVASVVADESWISMVVEADGVAGQVVLWPSEHGGVPLSETGWMILPGYQGRGLAVRAMEALLARADRDGRWGAIHAFPGATNAASNGVARHLGFVETGPTTTTFQGRVLPVRHWVRPAPG